MVMHPVLLLVLGLLIGLAGVYLGESFPWW